MPDWKRKVVKESMFQETYTVINNETDRPEDMKHDPLNLKRCLRIFPHDQNQGGFFVAVFTKLLDDHEGFEYDELYEKNAWEDPNIRQKPIMQDLREFAEEYEKDLQKYEAENNIPKDQSSHNQILSVV